MKLKVLLYPCPCCDTWSVDEWRYDGEKIDKRYHVAEFKSIHEAAEHYRTVLGTVKGSFYDEDRQLFGLQRRLQLHRHRLARPLPRVPQAT